MRKCQQMQCDFNRDGGCHACAECQTESNMIKPDCSVCLACEGLPNMLRWDDPRPELARLAKALKNKGEEEMQREQQKVVEVM